MGTLSPRIRLDHNIILPLPLGPSAEIVTGSFSSVLHNTHPSDSTTYIFLYFGLCFSHHGLLPLALFIDLCVYLWFNIVSVRMYFYLRWENPEVVFGYRQKSISAKAT